MPLFNRWRGDLLVDDAHHRVWWMGREIPLTTCEFKLVRKLIDEMDVVLYEDIYAAYHRNWVPASHRLAVKHMIERVRAKFKYADRGFTSIANHPGLGYEWVP